MPDIIREKLFSMADEAYAKFNSKLIPNIDSSSVIGVRMPMLRTLAKSLNECETEQFINKLPHKYHEENMLHAILISNMSSPEDIIKALDAFLPYVDNWAVCDCLRPVKLKSRPQEFDYHIRRFLLSKHSYTVRFAVEMLMCYFLDEHYSQGYPELVSKVCSDDYYVNMMLAWYFATALAKRWHEIIPYIENRSLSPWVHNKTIQKARESYRISLQQKEYLKGMRI